MERQGMGGTHDGRSGAGRWKAGSAGRRRRRRCRQHARLRRALGLEHVLPLFKVVVVEAGVGDLVCVVGCRAGQGRRGLRGGQRERRACCGMRRDRGRTMAMG